MVNEALAPVMSVFEVSRRWTSESIEAFTRMKDLMTENEDLRKRTEELERIENEVLELQEENSRLRRILHFVERSPFEYIPAQVIGRSPDNWSSIIRIDKGEINGVTVDMPVVTDAGLVGRVTQVSRGVSVAMLLTDRESRVGAMIQGSRDTGILSTDLDTKDLLYLRLFSTDADVRVGDRVITSGLGVVFPEGLLIGRVVKVKTGEGGLIKYALVEPAVNLDRLEEVLLLKKDEGMPVQDDIQEEVH